MQMRCSARMFWLISAGLVSTLLLPPGTTRGHEVTVREPAFGLPHFFADTDVELARENGREIAKDRLAQLILLALSFASLSWRSLLVANLRHSRTHTLQ